MTTEDILLEQIRNLSNQLSEFRKEVRQDFRDVHQEYSMLSKRVWWLFGVLAGAGILASVVEPFVSRIAP